MRVLSMSPLWAVSHHLQAHFPPELGPQSLGSSGNSILIWNSWEFESWTSLWQYSHPLGGSGGTHGSSPPSCCTPHPLLHCGAPHCASRGGWSHPCSSGGSGGQDLLRILNGWPPPSNPSWLVLKCKKRPC